MQSAALEVAEVWDCPTLPCLASGLSTQSFTINVHPVSTRFDRHARLGSTRRFCISTDA
jgi:hypothetical protein